MTGDLGIFFASFSQMRKGNEPHEQICLKRIVRESRILFREYPDRSKLTRMKGINKRSKAVGDTRLRRESNLSKRFYSGALRNRVVSRSKKLESYSCKQDREMEELANGETTVARAGRYERRK
ncbi:uncharacterized protein LOC122535454 [Frieseomelitta varia]|uniref:uncharacterized protein LOC122535454 n=1 Tax=Frieseomelitta varia TaxID=561572 RepID=UPI001CB6AFE9|nr:uncharacterized protein LOC122535454 [Frieseomelitta varia]